METRLSGIKQAVLDCSLQMDTFLNSNKICKSNMREIHQSGHAPELNSIANLDERLSKLAWYPRIIKLFGKVDSYNTYREGESTCRQAGT